MIYDAVWFGEKFVEAARLETARRSYKHGISRGTGHIPYDTGRTQRSVYMSFGSATRCTVEIGGDAAPYAIYLQCADNVANTGVINRHKGFVERFAKTSFVDILKKEFGEVKIL